MDGSTTLSLESGSATIVADEFYLLDNKIVSGSQMITNPTTFETSSISLVVTFTEFSLQAYSDSAQLQHSANGNLSFSPAIHHSPVSLKKPNGIIGPPDGKKLYIADIGDGKT